MKKKDGGEEMEEERKMVDAKITRLQRSRLHLQKKEP